MWDVVRDVFPYCAECITQSLAVSTTGSSVVYPGGGRDPKLSCMAAGHTSNIGY